jgi:hypothetical protein
MIRPQEQQEQQEQQQQQQQQSSRVKCNIQRQKKGENGY